MTDFEKNISTLDFHFKKKSTEGGVLLTHNYMQHAGKLSPQELFALETAATFQADAVYFRYFKDGRESVPQIYIYDNTDNHLTEQATRDIHIKVWSGCQVPIFIIVDKTQVKIFDARERVKMDSPNHALETIQLIGSSLKQFSAASFDDGLFWEEEKNTNKFQFATSAYRDLITGLKNVYADFQTASKLNSHVALKLLVQCLLIKYLEERDEQSSHGYFTKTYFKNHFQSENFCAVIRQGKLLELLDKLSIDFNGKVFEWDVDEEKKARADINKAAVRKLADYLDGNSQDEQYVIWRLYSFSHLPVELISSVYEELLTNSKDIVYTPEMIVSTLIDECMPLKSPKKDFKVIDVSCGSGIFLVKAYKRLIQWWRYENWKETGEFKRPDLSTLKELLTKSVFGIDIQDDAIRLSVFGLALALLDEVDLSPPVWQKLKFPDLGKNNIIAKDFFEFVTRSPAKDFDLVIGNPPFNPPTKDDGKKIGNGVYFDTVKKKFGYQSEIKIPDQNLALHFLVQAMQLLKPNALLCLIQPSAPLLYQKDESFKKQLFSKYNLLQLIDFTKLADKLWGKKNVATAAVFLQNAVPDGQRIVHLVANRTASNTKKLFLEIDHYDFHSVSKESAITESHIWKSNLLGGGRIANLLGRLEQFNTLGEFVKEKEEKHGWKIGEGFKEKGANPKPCKYITNHPYLPSEAFDENGIDESQIHNCKINRFYRKGDPKIYKPPHLLIKENIGVKKLSVFLSDEYLVFMANIIGIHAPEKDRGELQKVESYFKNNNDLLRFIIRATSSQLSISKATVPLKEDFMNLPFSETKGGLKISGIEKILIKESLNYELTAFKKQLFEFCEEKQLKTFSKLFCQVLNSVYEANGKTFQLLKILDSGHYFALHFSYSKGSIEAATQQTDDLEKYIQQVIPTQSAKNKGYHIQRVLKIYGKDTIILVKPKSLRYWLQSIALRDADETFADYVKAGF